MDPLSLLQRRAQTVGMPFTKREEACRLEVYDDGRGNATIGWGNTFYTDGSKVQFSDAPITQQYADMMFFQTWTTTMVGVCDKLLRDPTPCQLAALVDLTYNIGQAAFGTSTVLAQFNAGDLEAAHAAFALWNMSHVGGRRQIDPVLVRRRAREMVLFEQTYTDPVSAPQAPPASPQAPTTPVVPGYRVVAMWTESTGEQRLVVQRDA